VRELLFFVRDKACLPQAGFNRTVTAAKSTWQQRKAALSSRQLPANRLGARFPRLR
jgi:hypothetical protein